MSTVTRSGSDYYDVHLGFWTNWSYGRIAGSTITLTRKEGGLLIGFLAIFVAMSGKSFWRIVCFILHRSLSSPTPQDGLYHQRQAILRNAETPEDAAIRMLHLLRVWRKNALQPFLRLLPVILMAVCTSVAFLIGGIFSSHVTTDTGNEVLITGKNCGPMGSGNDIDTTLAYLQPYVSQRATAYSNYALQCYTDATNAEDCNLYVKSRIKTNIQTNASCPFAEEMCKTKDHNIIVDTGLIDSHRDLGINAPPQERFQMRYVHQCAPIISEGYRTIINTSDDARVPAVVQYNYGNLTYGAGALTPYAGQTYEVFKNFTSMDLPGYSSALSMRPEYGLGTVISFGGDVPKGSEITEFNPIPQLVRDDADTTLLFLTAQGIGFLAPIDDLWYGAHEKWVTPLSISSEGAKNSLYLTDEPASALGCATQLQFCNPNLPEDSRCEPLRGVNDNVHRQGISWSTEQLHALNWTATVMYQGTFSPNNFAAMIGTSLLTARYSLTMGLSGPLPTNQWQLEVEHMIGSSLASLQGAFVDAASGPKSNSLRQFAVSPPNEQAKRMCTNQKIISTQYSSFSVLGLAVILILGSVLIVFETALEPMLNFYQQKRAKHSGLPHHTFTSSTHSRLEWQATSVLQLQRLAHEAVGSGTWYKTSGENPVTLPIEKLGILDVSDEERPLLRQLVKTSEEVVLSEQPPIRGLTRAQTDMSERTMVSHTSTPAWSLKSKASTSDIKKTIMGKR